MCTRDTEESFLAQRQRQLACLSMWSLNLDQALQVMDYLKPKQGYFTHISHLLGLHQQIQKELPTNIHLAYDGLTIEI